MEDRQGAVVAEVGANAGALRFVNPYFSFRAVDSRFRLDLQGVATERGLVEVFTRADYPLAKVGPGQRWGEGVEPGRAAGGGR